jgi:hypothetical protein
VGLERRFTNDELLTTVTLYWATQTIGSSLRVYRDWALGMEDRPETWRVHQRDWAPAGVEPRPLEEGERIRVPAAVALFDYQAPREWVERAYADLRRFAQMPAAATSPPWRSRSCSPRTCVPSSDGCAEDRQTASPAGTVSGAPRCGRGRRGAGSGRSCRGSLGAGTGASRGTWSRCGR